MLTDVSHCVELYISIGLDQKNLAIILRQKAPDFPFLRGVSLFPFDFHVLFTSGLHHQRFFPLSGRTLPRKKTDIQGRIKDQTELFWRWRVHFAAVEVRKKLFVASRSVHRTTKEPENAALMQRIVRHRLAHFRDKPTTFLAIARVCQRFKPLAVQRTTSHDSGKSRAHDPRGAVRCVRPGSGASTR